MVEAPPDHLRYTAAHEWIDWIDGSGDPVTIGVTAFAADQLGDIVYVGLPAVGDALSAGAVCGELESTKSVSDLYAPVSGTVVGVNDAVVAEPGLVNSAPFDDGWLLRVELTEPPTDLLSAAEYLALTDGALTDGGAE
ncbi:MAG TPA: glycine cleavage system protein GcvH [Pseudonocardiaceae bacterium]|nr:glycine cleavage system protein GcvH [Pseudonocardiaceae bacterium]